MKAYVNGGVTFTYPVDMFLSPPFVTATVEANTHTYTSSDKLSSIVTSNTATAATVRVNINGVEAVNNAVNVTILVVSTDV